MAALELNIERCKFPVTEKETAQASYLKDQRSLPAFFSRVKSVFPKFLICTTDPEYIPTEYSIGDYKLFIILRDFVQPNSTLALIDAVRLTLQINPNGDDVVEVTGVVFELAEQIPYHHPGQQKLARFLWSVGRSEERIQRRGDKQHQAVDEFFSIVAMELQETCCTPDPSEEGFTTDRFVNFQAFKANLLDIGAWLPSAAPVMHTMRLILDGYHEEEPQEIQDAWILGAAQWILWNGQLLFKLILYPGDIWDKSNLKDRVPAESDNPDWIDRLTLGKWHVWRQKFVEASTSKNHGRECKDVALRAAEMMTSIEKGMLF